MAARFVTDIDKVPVTVLTGFLGAGKTTQLNHPHRTARQADRRHRERVRRGRCDVAGAADVDALVAGQTPGRWVNLVGELVIARNPRPPVRPAELPAELAKAVESEVALYRVGAVWQLAQWITDGDPGQNLTATDVLERLTRDYDQRVQTAAKAVLAGQVASRPRVPESTPGSSSSTESRRRCTGRRGAGATGWSRRRGGRPPDDSRRPYSTNWRSGARLHAANDRLVERGWVAGRGPRFVLPLLQLPRR